MFRNALIFAAGVVCGLVVAALGARELEQPTREAAPKEAVAGTQLASKKTVAHDRDQLAGARNRIAALEHELYGEPMAWPDDTPYLADPKNYAREFARALDACQVPVDVVGYDCTEPPCYAVLRRDELAFSSSDELWSTISDCEYWQDRYYPGVGMATDSVDCGDGREEGILLLSVQPREDPNWLTDPDADRAVLANSAKRFDLRKKAAEEAWRCEDE
jgi:hypothetical protein